MTRRADSLIQIYDFETQIEDAIEFVLNQNTGVATYTQRSDRELLTPRYEVQCTTGAATGSYSVPTADLNRYPDAFNAALKVRHITSRKGDVTYTQHRQNVAKIRQFIYGHENLVDDRVMPFLKIDSILETGSSQGVDEEARHDMTELNFAVVFFVRPSAWPSA